MDLLSEVKGLEDNLPVDHSRSPEFYEGYSLALWHVEELITKRLPKY